MSAAVVHSHRPTTNPGHKSFKSRKSTKSQIRDAAKGRIEKGSRKTPHQQVMSKLERRNQAKQRQLVKAKEHQRETSVFAGRDGAPRIVAVLPLCADSDARDAIAKLNESVDIEADVSPDGGDAGCIGVRVPIDRFKQKLQYIPLRRDLTLCLDAARVADFIVIILSAMVPVDALGELILRSVETQGMSTLYTVVRGMEELESARKRTGVLASLRSYITHFHPEQDKLFGLDNRQECSNLMRALCSTTPKGVHWRDDRSWMLVDNVRLPSAESGSTVVTGVVRGKGLKADRLVQLGDIGVFKIDKITAAPPPKALKMADGVAADGQLLEETVLDVAGPEQDDLADLAPEEVDMADVGADDMASVAATKKKGVLLDDHHYFEEEEEEELDEDVVRGRVPKGTSRYQAAWFLGGDGENTDDNDSDYEDLEMRDAHDGGEEPAAVPQDGVEGLAPAEMMDTESEHCPQSEMFFVEPTADDDAAQLAAYRSRKHEEAEDDKEFPDEIELHPNALARERLSRYRGLKSLRCSPWKEDEDRAHEPSEWRRLLQVPDYQGSRSRATREALVGGVAPGTRVNVYLAGVLPADFEKSFGPHQPISMISLLRHEQKRSVVNHLITLSSDHPTSIKAKDELIIQCGPRRVIARPQFSQPGSTPNNIHKSCRYLHPGQSAVASFMGPVTWGAVPTLFFKRTSPEEVNENGEKTPGLALVATGTSMPPSTSRVVVKRVVLTGHPLHIHKTVVTIRYMFFNREDVEWFKALPLWTRRGRGGYIKEAIGTHGYFKATFDGKINSQDAIGVSLYKRVFPRDSEPFKGSLLSAAGDTAGEDTAMI